MKKRIAYICKFHSLISAQCKRWPAKRVDLSIDDKLKVLEALKTPGGAIMKVAMHPNISESEIRRIKQSKESLTQLQHSLSILGSKKKTVSGAK